MRPVGVTERIGGRRGNHRNVDVYFAILNGLPAPAMGPQHAHPTHLSLSAIVTQRAVHAAFDVMNDAGLHELNRGLLRRERRTRKPHQIFDADSCRRFERHERDPVAIAQVMMIRDDHAIAQAAIAQSSFEIGHALVTILRIIFAGINGWGSLSTAGLVLCHAEKWDLRLAVDHGGHAASDGILSEFDAFRHSILCTLFQPPDGRVARYHTFLDFAHRFGSCNQLACALDHRRIDHLRAQAYHAESALLRLFESGNDLQRSLNLCLRRREGLVND